jgi:hypothetical protein
VTTQEAKGSGATGQEKRRPAAAVRRSPLLLRRVNEIMREGRRGRTELELIPFFCECQRDDCYGPVWLTAAAYDERRTKTQRPLILPGHGNERRETKRRAASR